LSVAEPDKESFDLKQVLSCRLSEFLVPDPWVEANLEVKPDLAPITDKLQNAKLKELQQIKQGMVATTAAWNGLPQSERDRLTELTQFQSGAQPETDLWKLRTENSENSTSIFRN